MHEFSASLQTLVETVATLRSDKGCPWDRRQTSLCLVKYLREESQELIEAIESEDHQHVCEELGDLLYLIIMISHIENQKQHFDLGQVINSINEKLVRRHPHVFGDATVATDEELRAQWEQIKAAEKKNSR